MDDPILDAREARFLHIKETLQSYQMVILVKANIPGNNKNTWYGRLLVNYFTRILCNTCGISDFSKHESEDGVYALLKFKQNGIESIKKVLIHIEDTHPIGRHIDLDIYSKDRMRSLSRRDLNIAPRKCIICQDAANDCIRLSRHPHKLLLERIENDVTFLLHLEIRRMMDLSMTKELNLEDKFGLITKTSNGSHKDMDYHLMVRAKDAILDGFIQTFKLGMQAESLDGLFNEGRKIGQAIEIKMLSTTRGINCYKGIIFIFSLLTLSLGYTIKHQKSFENLFNHMIEITKDLFNDFHTGNQTFGIKAYQEYGITGIRGEVKMGLPSVKMILSNYPDLHQANDLNLRKALRDLIIHSDDTVFLKRSGSIKRYHEIKEAFRNLDFDDPEKVKAFSDTMIKERLSFGGAADLLITSLFLSQIKYLF